MAQFYDPIESTTLTHADEHRGSTGRDLARSEGALPLATLERFLDDLRWEVEWRRHADICVDYYDGNQLDSTTLNALEAKGLGPLIRNIIHPTIDAVLGLEERTKTDWKVVSDYDDEQDVAEALSVKLTEAEREAHADRACSEAYAGQVKAGLGVVEVSRASNPFHYPYRVQSVHRREIYWDPRSRQPDWSDARYVLRKRWFDVDVAAAYFPQQSHLLRFASEGWEGWQELARLSNHDVTSLNRSFLEERDTSIDDMEWRDTNRGRVCIYEVWYRIFHRGLVMRLPRGRVVEFNQANPQHLAIVGSGVVQPFEAVYDKLRCAYFAGPHRLADFGTKRRRFPYVPLWGFREDLTGAPYGLIRSMLSVQDEINARLAKMMWLLSSRRVLIDSDALDPEYNTHSDATREIGRADAYLVLNPNRTNKQGALQVDENLQLAEAQRLAMVDAVAAMPMVAGIYAPMMGNTSSTTAASAIKQLIDQGTTTLAEINGNYAYARRMVGDALLELIKEDLSGVEENVTIDTGVAKRSVFINRKGTDPRTGLQTVENNTDATLSKVQLSDVPSSASYRQQQFTQLSEIAKSLPPDLQAFIVPFIIESSDMARRREVAKLLREKLGINLDDQSPEGQAAKQQAEKQAALEAEQLAKKFDAELGEILAKTAKLAAETDEIKADIARSALDAQAQAAATGQADGIRREYESRIGEITQKLAQNQLDQHTKRAEIQAKVESEEARQREETERERIRAASAAEVARINGEAERVRADLKAQIKALGAEVDDRLKELSDSIPKAEAGTTKPAARKTAAKKPQRSSA